MDRDKVEVDILNEKQQQQKGTTGFIQKTNISHLSGLLISRLNDGLICFRVTKAFKAEYDLLY